jgi:HK97 family phage major capsid protein
MEDNRQIARSIVQKADASVAGMTSGGGVLLPAQAKTFYQMAIDDSKLMKMISVPPLSAPVQEVDKLGFLSTITRGGSEGQALSQADRASPSFDKVTFTTVELKFQVNLSEQVLEDNIEGDSLQTKIMSMITERFALDAEYLLVNGNTSSTDALLKKLNGLLVLVSSHQVDNGVHQLCQADFFEALQTLPSAYQKDLSALRFLTSPRGELKWRDVIASRAGGGGGIADAAVTSSQPIPAYGVPVVGIPVFPNNLGTGTNETNTILTDPKNIAMGVYKKVTIKTQEDIQAGVYMVVGRARIAVEFMHEPAVVQVLHQLTI